MRLSTEKRHISTEKLDFYAATEFEQRNRLDILHGKYSAAHIEAVAFAMTGIRDITD